MELNKIKNEGKWSEQTTRLNSNFNKINQETESLKSTYRALTQSDVLVVSTLPAEGVANTIYRVVGNGSYSDYMYNSDDLTTPILMATYNNAIDTYPQEDSENLITSGAVYEAMQDMLEQSAVRTDTAQDLTGAQKATALGNLGISGIDDVPTAGSENLVKSGGVKSAIDVLQDNVTDEIEDFENVIITQIDEYKPIVINGDVTNAADEEDLTSSNGLLKLKNRNSLYGMGKIILRRNQTFAEQLTQTNTIYIIQYDFDLNGATVTIPENCVLQFEGGSLSNGELVGQNTVINSPKYLIFVPGVIKYNGYKLNNEYNYVSNLTGDLIVSGTWGNDVVEAEWIGLDTPTQDKDFSFLIEKYITLHKNNCDIILPQNTYWLYKPIIIKNKKVVDFNNSIFNIIEFSNVTDITIPIPQGSEQKDIRSVWGTFTIIGASNIKNGIFEGNRDLNGETAGVVNDDKIIHVGESCLLDVGSSDGLIIENCTFKHSITTAVALNGTITNIEFKNCLFKETTEHGIYSKVYKGNVCLTDCVFTDIADRQYLADVRGPSGALKANPENEDPQHEYADSVVYKFNNCSFNLENGIHYYAIMDGWSYVEFNHCYIKGYEDIMFRSGYNNRKVCSVIKFNNCDGCAGSINSLQITDVYYKDCVNLINPDMVHATSIDNCTGGFYTQQKDSPDSEFFDITKPLEIANSKMDLNAAIISNQNARPIHFINTHIGNATTQSAVNFITSNNTITFDNCVLEFAFTRMQCSELAFNNCFLSFFASGSSFFTNISIVTIKNCVFGNIPSSVVRIDGEKNIKIDKCSSLEDWDGTTRDFEFTITSESNVVQIPKSRYNLWVGLTYDYSTKIKVYQLSNFAETLPSWTLQNNGVTNNHTITFDSVTNPMKVRVVIDLGKVYNY